MEQTSPGFGRHRGKSFSLSSLRVGIFRDFSPALHRGLIFLMIILVTGSIVLGICGKTVGDFVSAARVDSFNWKSIFPSVFDQSDRPLAATASERLSTSDDLFFVENAGQFEEGILFAVQTESGVLFLGEDAIWMMLVESPQTLLRNLGDQPPGYMPDKTLQGISLRLTFPDANPFPAIIPFDPLAPSFSYFIGSDPADWVVQAPVWRGVRYEGLYPGLDLEITSEDGAWIWRLLPQEMVTQRIAPFTLQAESEEPQVQLRIEGADDLTLDSDTVWAETALGELAVPLLDAEAAAGTALVPDEATPRLDEDRVVDPFQSPPAVDETGHVPDGSSKLASLWSVTISRMIDRLRSGPAAEARPGDLLFSTYLGSPNGNNWSYAIDVDAEGSAYLGGFVLSPNLPTTPGAFQTTWGDSLDGFAAKFNADASVLVYASYIAGSGEDEVRGLSVDSDGSVVLVGRTTSSDFPVTPGAADTTLDEGDAFVLKLNSEGSDLIYSTFLGGTGGEEGMDIALDASGSAYVTGQTTSSDFPVTPGAAQGMHGGGDFDGFVAKLTPDGSSLAYATYLGGSSTDCEIGDINQECAIAVDASGSAYIGGPTYSVDFPVTTGAFDIEANGGRDAFIAKLSADGDVLEFATFIGGSGDECQRACDIAVDSYGAPYLTGATTSTDFPTTSGAWDEDHNGGWDAFAAKLSPDGSRLLYGTYFGGTDLDSAWTASVTRAGELFIAGETLSSDLPTTNAGAPLCASCPDRVDIFLALIKPDGSLSYATYLGGSDDDAAFALTLDGEDHVYLTGRTHSLDYPTTSGVYQTSRLGDNNSFLTRLDVETADPPVIDLEASTIEVEPAEVIADGVQAATLSVTLVDQGGNRLPSWPVEVFTDGEEVSYDPGSQLTTDISGVATVELQSTIVQTIDVSVRELFSQALLFDSETLSFVAGPSDPDRSTIISDKTTVTADGIDFATLTITLLDALDHPVSGHGVVLRINDADGVTFDMPDPVTDENGQVIAEVRSSAPMLVTFGAGDLVDELDINDTVTIEFLLTDPDLSSAVVSPDTVPADGVTEATLTVTLLNHSSAPVSGHTVTLMVDPYTDIFVNGGPASSAPFDLGPTDENGMLTATLKSTRAGIKTLTVTDATVGITLSAQPRLEFSPGPPDQDQSTITALAESAPADAITDVQILITARDEFANHIPGVDVTLIASSVNAVLSQPSATTDENGQTSGFISNGTVETVELLATIDGVLITERASIAFRGADLALTKSGEALSNYDGLSDTHALSGGTITYLLEVLNEGLMPGEGVMVTDTLPAGLSFVPDPNPSYAHTEDGQTITWQVGSLPVGDTATIDFEAAIDGSVLGSITNTATTSTTGDEDDLLNNDAELQTTVETPRPVMNLSPAGPTLSVQQGETNSLTAMVRNSGAGEMSSITVVAPPTIPWVSVDAVGLTSLDPRTEGTFEVNASPPETTIPGSYRDFIAVSDVYGNSKRMALTVVVSAPRRGLAIFVENDQGQLVAGAEVQLIRQQASVVVTEGVMQTYHETVSGRTNASGGLPLPGLQIGVYDYIVVADDHDNATGEITVVEGDGAQIETIKLQANGRIGLSPASPRIGVVPGTVADAQITLTNLGQAPLTGLEIQPPAALLWVTVASPDPIPDLAAGASMTFNVIASPSVDLTIDIFQDVITVSADGVIPSQVALTIELTSELTRDARVDVVDDFDDPVAGGGEVVLIEQETTELQLPSGEIRTFNQHYNSPLISSGRALFTGLNPGTYTYFVSPNGYTRETGEIEIIPGAGEQELIVRSSFDPFTYSWSVVPLDVGYEITLTMTYDVTTPIPRLEVPEVCWNPGDSPTTQNVYLYNPSGLPMTLEGLNITLPGADLTIGSLPTTIPSDSLISVPIDVVKTDVLSPGIIEVDYAWQRALDDFVTFTLNPSSKESPLIPPGFFFETEYVIQPAVFTDGVTYTLNVVQPSDLDWITLSLDPSEPMIWNGSPDIALDVVIDPPQFLETGIYTDEALIRVDGDDGTWREGYLEFEVTRTNEGAYVHTTFTLGDVPTEARQAMAQGAIRAGNCTEWTWSSAPGSGALVGRSSGRGVSFPTFAGAPSYNFDHQQVRMEISQKVMLEGEAFQARLEIENTSAELIEMVSVDVRLTDLDGVDKSFGFELIPETPTDLGTISVGGGADQDWILLPSLLGVTDPEGEPFMVSAVITYTWVGQTFFTETAPELITVYPSPDLVITYQLPLPTQPCTDFPLKVTIQNRGAGPARNLRFSTSLPKVVDPDTGVTIPFTITETIVNGVSIGPILNVELGDVAPDPENPAVIVWRLSTTLPGRFVEFTSDFRQINPLGLPLKPLISEVRTFFVPGPCGGVPDKAVFCPSGECPSIALNGTQDVVGKPINTRTGGQSFQAADFSFPTSAGALTFNRWYASPTTEDYIELLGPGWTHSLDSRLIFPDDPLGELGVVQLKLHSSNRLDFFDVGGGQYEAHPGVCGHLEALEGGGYAFTDDAQRTYTFDEEGRILSLTDPQGNTLTYIYDGEGRLERASDLSGARYLELVYDVDGRIETVRDHTGRVVNYAYDEAGDLTGVTDVLGQVWIYAYDDAHRMVEARDPSGAIIERTEYDAEGRAVRQFNGKGDLVVELTYNADGTTTVTDANGNSRVDRYDERGALVDQTDPLGASMTKDYDGNFRPTELTDPAGNATMLAWSSDGANLTGVEDALGNEVSLAYDELNNLTSVVDARGEQTNFGYDGRLLTSTQDALGNTTTYAYTPEGNLDSVTDARGGTTRYTYESHGQRTSMTDALGNTWFYRYDDLGRLVESEDPLGRVTHSEYDVLGRLVSTTRNYDPGRPQNDEDQFNIVTEYIYDQAGRRTRMTDTYNRVTRYEYDDDGRLLRVIDPAGNETVNQYDKVGNLTVAIDPLNRTTSFVYDEQNRLTRSIDALGNVTIMEYDVNGNVKSTTDALGRTYTFEYDDLNRQVALVDPLGNRSESTYDTNGNLAFTTDAAGRTTTFAYDELNRTVRQTDPEGGVTQHKYDSISNRVRTIDANGHETRFEYDTLNRLKRVTDHLGNSTDYAYNPVGSRVSVTDANGNTTTLSYDALDRMVQSTDPLGNSSQTEFDALGNTLSRNDPNGLRTTFAYDVLNRLIAQTDPLGGVTAYAYDAVGNQVEVTDANGNTKTSEYNVLNRPIRFTDPNGNSTTSAYNAVGNVVTITDALGAVTAFEYDLLNRQTGVIDPLNNITAYVYDPVGNRTTMTDAEGVATRYEYDKLNRLSAVVENYLPAMTADHQTNVRTAYGYDPVGNRLSITDANGHVTDFSYDELNRLALESDPLGNATAYGYDSVGNRVSLTDAMGFTTGFVYDATNMLVNIDYPDPDSDVTFEYDAAGVRVRMTDSMGTTIWAYDDVYRPTAVTDPFGDSVGYAYDGVGNRTGLTYPDGKQVAYDYDAGNRLSQVTDWASLVTTYNYDAVNRLQTVLLPNEVTSSYDYDEAGRVLEIHHESSSELLSSFQYDYDAIGNRVQAVETMLWPSAPEPVVSISNDSRGAQPALVFTDPGMAFLAPMALLIFLPLSRRRKDAPKLLIALAILAGALMALSACAPPTPTPTIVPTITPTPTPTSTPTPTPTPGGTTSALREAIAEARSVLAGLIDSGEVERVPGIILDRRLRLADRFLELGMEARALQQLELFVRTVERYRGNRISEEAADALVDEIQPIVDAVERDLLLPTVTCVEELAYGWIGHFGFINPNDSTEIVPVGVLNRFDPAPEDRGQPTSFEPGAHEDLFTVAYESEALIWDLDGNQAIASGESPRCDTLPPEPVTTITTIDYVYDPLYRLVEANYDSGEFFHYAYDAVGNRQTQTTHLAENTYTYDIANRLVDMDGVPYSWDEKGNLLDDGTRTYTYDHANRMTSVVMGADAYSYAYNGLGDRLRQTVNGTLENYTLDLVAGLTQVLGDGNKSYLYGVGRIGEKGSGGFTYYIGDALTSVRQIVDASSALAFSQSFEPFGSRYFDAGVNPTSYAFVGEWQDRTDLIQLRARYYDPTPGRFIQPDSWSGDVMRPDTINIYGYVNNNPTNSTDPSGRCYPPLEWLRNIPPDDLLCEYMDMAAFITGAPMATQGEKRLAWTYIGGWAVAHSALIVAAGFFVAGTAISAAPLVQSVVSWAAQGLVINPLTGAGVTAWEAAQLIPYAIGTSEFAVNAGIAAELYLTYQAVACKDENAIGILTSGWFITGQSFIQDGLKRGFGRIANTLRLERIHRVLSRSDPLDAFGLPRNYVMDDKSFVSYTQELETLMRQDPNLVLSSEQESLIIELADIFDVPFLIEPGHLGTPWSGIHLHISPSRARVHLRVLPR